MTDAHLGLVAPQPLYRDPVYDGAADPVVVWNRDRGEWWMLYTNRRANVPGLSGVSWVHGTEIGIAVSRDGGATWQYRGTADIIFRKGEGSYWAPDVLFHDGAYHMFLSYVPGMHTDWSGPREIWHLTSNDLHRWQYQSTLPLASDRVIDASVARLQSGVWRLWYKNEADQSAIYFADSPDLFRWTDVGKIKSDEPHEHGEGPKVFFWHNRWWMIVDHWRGLGVYHSADATTWTRQSGYLLSEAGQGTDDGTMGNHADVVVGADGRAFLFYFTHPDRVGDDAGKDGYEQRRTSIQVVELEMVGDRLTCDRDKPTHLRLMPKENAA